MWQHVNGADPIGSGQVVEGLRRLQSQHTLNTHNCLLKTPNNVKWILHCISALFQSFQQFQLGKVWKNLASEIHSKINVKSKKMEWGHTVSRWYSSMNSLRDVLRNVSATRNSNLFSAHSSKIGLKGVNASIQGACEISVAGLCFPSKRLPFVLSNVLLTSKFKLSQVAEVGTS